jgi:hypothetical protein
LCFWQIRRSSVRNLAWTWPFWSLSIYSTWWHLNPFLKYFLRKVWASSTS